jgi:hypothetical protein
MTAEKILLEGIERHRAGDLVAAAALYRATLALQEHPTALYNLAVILDDAGQPGGRDLLERLVRARPRDPKSLFRLASHYSFTGALELAEVAYRQTLAMQADYPQAAVDLGICLLRMGRYAEAWPLHEGRRSRQEMLGQGLSFPEWEGQSLEGKRLLIWREQGYGDQIMIARFFPMLGAGSITYAGPAALERLFSQTPVDYMSVKRSASVPRHDFWTLPFSIPARLGITPHTIPTAPYFAGLPGGGRGGVGVAWRGDPRNQNDRNRSLPPEMAAELLALPGAVSLHPEHTGARDFQETADLIAGLDLVIAVDTSIAHLAGAMGRPTWILLPALGADWRWMMERSDSPWYPTSRLFRQRTPGDWRGVLDAVRSELRTSSAAHDARGR